MPLRQQTGCSCYQRQFHYAFELHQLHVLRSQHVELDTGMGIQTENDKFALPHPTGSKDIQLDRQFK